MRIKTLLLLCVGLLFSVPRLEAQQSPSPSSQKIRSLVNLLDYVGKDYPNAITDGKVKNKIEYQEMLEFSDRIQSLHKQLAPEVKDETFRNLDDNIDRLENAIKEKASPREVGKQAADIQQQILALNLITVTPSKQPDLAQGKQLFKTHCSSCHGDLGRGNGPLAKQLDPKPSNFHDDTLAAKLSPLQAYNTVRLGIKGTGMRPFTELSDQEVWDIAFYVNRLNYSSEIPEAKAQHIRSMLQDTATMKTLTTWKNKQWLAFFRKQKINPREGMSVVRSIQKVQNSDDDYLAKAESLLKSAGEAYSANQPEKAHQLALDAYLHGVEPMESQIKASDPGMVSDIENKMIDTRAAIKEHQPAQKVQQKIQAATASIHQAQNLLNSQDYSFWFTFTMAASILLREGLEAVLIILVIISVLKSMDAHRSLKYVHGGWISALSLGIISWFFAQTLIQMSSFQREIMEGVGSLIAVGMLIYIGFWLHNKTHASQWTKFVKEKITSLVDENNRWGLAVLAFIVVFREAFESVIFLSSISIKSTAAGNTGIMLGSASALGIVIVLAALIIRFSKQLPIRSLFKYSSFIMSLLAVILVGKGIHEFQEAGYLGIHSIPALPNLPLLGLYPTLFTVLSQLLIIGVIVGLWQLSKRLAVTSAASQQT